MLHYIQSLNVNSEKLYPYIMQRVQVIQIRIISSVQNIHLLSWSLAPRAQRSIPDRTEITSSTDMNKTRISSWPLVTWSKRATKSLGGTAGISLASELKGARSQG